MRGVCQAEVLGRATRGCGTWQARAEVRTCSAVPAAFRGPQLLVHRHARHMLLTALGRVCCTLRCRLYLLPPAAQGLAARAIPQALTLAPVSLQHWRRHGVPASVLIHYMGCAGQGTSPRPTDRPCWRPSWPDVGVLKMRAVMG